MNTQDSTMDARNVIVVVVVVVIVFLTQAFTRTENLELLVSDDFVTVGKAVVDGCTYESGPVGPYAFVNCQILHTTQSVTAIKLVYLAVGGIAAIFGLLISTYFGINIYVAALVATVTFISPGLIPVGTFLTGSYPILGLLVLVPALYFGVKSIRSPPWQIGASSAEIGMSGHAATSLMLFILAPMTGGANIGASLAMLPIAILAFLARRPTRVFVQCLVIAVLPVSIWAGLQFSGVFANHYAELEGWIDFTPATMWAKALSTFEIVEANVNTIYAWITLGLLLLAITYTAICWCLVVVARITASERVGFEMLLETRTALTTGLLALAFLTFFPSLAVFHEALRYLAVPLVLVTLAGCLVIAGLLDSITPKLVVLTIPILVCFGGYSAYSTYSVQKDGGYLVMRTTQQKLAAHIDAKRESFAENSQIVVVLDGKQEAGTIGYNHWSTHYLRYLLSRSDVIGLVGNRSRLSEDPFVDPSAEDGDLWIVKNQRSYRRQMIGLEVGRPTYIYQMGEDSFQELDCITVNEAGGWGLYADSGSGITLQENLDTLDAKGLAESAYVNCLHFWQISHRAVPLENYEPSSVKDFGGNPEEVSYAQTGSSLPIDLKFSLKATARSENRYGYSDTSPPMPMVSKGFTVYQASDNSYRIVPSCEGGVAISIFDAKDWISFQWQIYPSGVGVLSVNGKPIHALPDCLPPGTLVLGKGFKERHWYGQLGDLVVTQ